MPLIAGHSRHISVHPGIDGPSAATRAEPVARAGPPAAADGPRTLARVNATDRTPADLLRSALAADPARPLVTFYDDATGERVELSVATFANWVAKTANLLQDELAAEPGDRLALLLPAHWQTRGVAARLLRRSGSSPTSAGDPAGADLVVSGPGHAGGGARLLRGAGRARAARRWAARFPQPPEGFADYAVEVPGQGDRFAPYAPGGPGARPRCVVGRARS